MMRSVPDTRCALGATVAALALALAGGAPASVASVPVIELSDSAWAVCADGGRVDITVTTDQPGWRADIPASATGWLSASPGSGQTGDVLTVTVARNNDTASRNAAITLSASGMPTRLEITQYGLGWNCSSVSLSQTAWTPPDAQARSIDVKVWTTESEWTVSSNQPWLTVRPTQGYSGQKFTVSVAANTSGPARPGAIALTAGRATAQLSVVQPGSPAPTLTLDGRTEQNWTPSAAATSTQMAVATNQPTWQASSNQAWLTVSPSSGTSGATMTASVNANNSPLARVGIVTLTAGGAVVLLAVAQKGDPGASPPGGSNNGGSNSNVSPHAGKVKVGKVTISGKKMIGAKLKAKRSKFEKGAEFAYKWLRNGKAIKGATKATYKLAKADRGKKITVKVTAKKKGLTSASVTSKAVKIPKK